MARPTLLLVLSLLAACSAAGRESANVRTSRASSASRLATRGEQARWDELSARYLERTFAHDPGLAVAQGRHEYDGQILDFSPAATAGWLRELQQFREQAERFSAAALDPARRFERGHLLASIDAELFWDGTLKEHERNPLVYANALDPVVYATRGYAPLDVRLRALIEHVRNMPRALDAMLQNLRTPLPRTFVEVGLTTIGGLGPYLSDELPAIFAEVRDPALQAELRAVTASARVAIERATRWFETQKGQDGGDFALGPQRFAEMLWATERVDTPLELLRAEGRRDLEQNLLELRRVCAVLLPHGSLAQCAALVNEQKPGAGPVTAAREQVAMLRRFVAQQELVTIPSELEAEVAEAPPYKRWNQAYIEIPGPYEPHLPATYYIAPPDPSWSAAERAAYVPGAFDLLYISVHEVWPGHFLQFLHANRVERSFARVFVGYAFAEGWAHYSEELMQEVGLLREEPKAHVGQLLNALLRNVRLVCAIGLHTEGMSVEQAERLFREQALTDSANARQQAARGTFDPGYLNYTLGKLMIRKLRADWTRDRGGRAAYREFHDRLLSFGGPPLPLVREAMLGEHSSPL